MGTRAALYIRPAAAIILIAVLAVLSLRRNEDWQTLLTIWSDCALKSPDKSRVRNHLGNCYLLLGQTPAAIGEYRKAVALDPGNMDAVYNLAISLDQAGSRADAIGYYERFCRSTSRHEEQKAEACARGRELAGTMRSRGNIRR